MRLTRSAALSFACAGTAAVLVSTAAAPAARAESTLPIGGLGDAAVGYAFHPNSVAGANDWSCKPSAAHPDPVVLLPGTFANIGANFVALSPMLKNAGYCVFATNFGMTWLSAGDRVGGLDTETTSGNQVAAFIDKVLASTGAQKVDIVGHSQGGSMGVNYLKLHDGGNKVGTYVGWGQSSNGTTLSGLVTGAQALGALGIFNVGLAALGAPVCGTRRSVRHTRNRRPPYRCRRVRSTSPSRPPTTRSSRRTPPSHCPVRRTSSYRTCAPRTRSGTSASSSTSRRCN